MSEESDLEKTEAASPRRLEKAREEGQIARSRELGTFLQLAAGVSVLWLCANGLYAGLSGIMHHGLAFDGRVTHDAAFMAEHAASSVGTALWTLSPVYLTLVLVALIGGLIPGGLVLSTKPLTPNFGKMNPIKGIGRMFSMQTLVELVKALAKAGLVGGVAAYTLWRYHDDMLALMHVAPSSALIKALALVATCCAFIVASLAVIVALDVPWQIWSHLKKLRMSKEDVKQEHKNSEGDPHVKARIRQQQRAMARRRMMSDVPRADVIVTNPTHYAVALKYDESHAGAPTVLAKGTGLVAAKIRELAAEHRIPTLEAPPLARALYQHVELGKEIPVALYTAVAEVLAWVFQLRSWRDGIGAEPREPTNLAVPAELDPQANAAKGV